MQVLQRLSNLTQRMGKRQFVDIACTTFLVQVCIRPLGQILHLFEAAWVQQAHACFFGSLASLLPFVSHSTTDTRVLYGVPYTQAETPSSVSASVFSGPFLSVRSGSIENGVCFPFYLRNTNWYLSNLINSTHTKKTTHYGSLA